MLLEKAAIERREREQWLRLELARAKTEDEAFLQCRQVETMKKAQEISAYNWAISGTKSASRRRISRTN